MPAQKTLKNDSLYLVEVLFHLDLPLNKQTHNKKDQHSRVGATSLLTLFLFKAHSKFSGQCSLGKGRNLLCQRRPQEQDSFFPLAWGQVQIVAKGLPYYQQGQCVVLFDNVTSIFYFVRIIILPKAGWSVIYYKYGNGKAENKTDPS